MQELFCFRCTYSSAASLQYVQKGCVIIASCVEHITKTLMRLIHSKAHSYYGVVWIQIRLLHLPELRMTVKLVS